MKKNIFIGINESGKIICTFSDSQKETSHDIANNVFFGKLSFFNIKNGATLEKNNLFKTSAINITTINMITKHFNKGIE